MIRTYSCRTVKKRLITAAVLFCVLYVITSWLILPTPGGYGLLLYVGGVLLAFMLLMRYLTSYKSLKGGYVFPKGGGPGEYFPGNTYTRKKYLRGMEIAPIYTGPITAEHSVSFAQDGKVMRLTISISFAPDILNLSLYIAHRRNWLNHFAAASALLREVLVELAKEGAGYCEECAEDRLRDGLRAFGLALNGVSRTLKSGTILLD